MIHRKHAVMRSTAMPLLAMLVCTAGCGDPSVSSSSDARPDSKLAGLVAAYPLKTCVVTGNELGSMGRPDDRLYQGRLVRFCCGTCLKDFNADPAVYMAKIDRAAQAQSPPN
jgi:hypothetical protein